MGSEEVRLLRTGKGISDFRFGLMTFGLMTFSDAKMRKMEAD